jgi:2-polyprenyl-6-methoxyphenol hydroxylase-like FAD-dependent oxidoreductase
MDVLWFRLPKAASDPERAAGVYLGADGVVVIMDRPDGWQVGYAFAKGAYQRLRDAGPEAIRRSVVDHAGWLADRIELLRDWRQVSLLSVDAGRVERWYAPGLLMIGDAAHVMSPVGGVGINYAVQDAVVAANILGPGLLQGTLRTADLAAVQRRRELPTRLMQALQRRMTPFSAAGQPRQRPPLVIRLAMGSPLAALPRCLIAFGGWRPERVRDLQSKRRGRLRRFAVQLAVSTAKCLWSALAQVDTRAFAVFGLPVYTHELLRPRHLRAGETSYSERDGKSPSEKQAAVDGG